MASSSLTPWAPKKFQKKRSPLTMGRESAHEKKDQEEAIYTHFLDDYRKQQMRKLRIDLPQDNAA
jgi:hypothetical protein